ncbi:hypothetical protein COCNU_scaffold039111G000010 [Cocos nucifera]|nr:hypothetical protein [Cocos nucifera]
MHTLESGISSEKAKSVAWEESEVMNSKDEECGSKIDDNLPVMPVPAKDIRQEIEEKHEKHPKCKEDQTATEKFEHISTDSLSVDRTFNATSMTFNATKKGEETIDQEDREEEGDKLVQACDVTHEDKLQENIHDEQNGINILKQETNSASLSAEQNHDLKKNKEIAILKDDESPKRNLYDTSLTITMDNSMELALEEEGGPESKLDVDELKTSDTMIPTAAHEKMTGSKIEKDNECLKRNSAISTIIKAFEEDSFEIVGGIEIQNANSEFQDEETVLALQGNQQTSKSSLSSCVEDKTLGEALETQSRGERFLVESSPTVGVDEKQTKERANVHVEEEGTNEEKDEKEEEYEHKSEKSGHDAAVVVEVKTADLKLAHKKSHTVLSGVGSKVKDSIVKVKKAITARKWNCMISIVH